MENVVFTASALPFFDSLSEGQKKEIENASEVKKLAKGERINGCEKNCIGPFLVLKGELRAVMDDENLREVTLFKLYEGDTGLLSATCVLEQIAFEASFITDTAVTLLVVKSCVLKRIMEENLAVRCIVFEILTDRFSACMTAMRRLLFTSYEKRLAFFLVETCVYGGNTELTITQEEIAKATSSAREVAGKTIRKFADDGILEYGRGRLKILDLKRLKDMI